MSENYPEPVEQEDGSLFWEQDPEFEVVEIEEQDLTPVEGEDEFDPDEAEGKE